VGPSVRRSRNFAWQVSQSVIRLRSSSLSPSDRVTRWVVSQFEISSPRRFSPLGPVGIWGNLHKRSNQPQ
jgi:hypothetical protein